MLFRSIVAIGRGGKPTNSGHIHYQCEEPGYIIGLMAITPMIDYSQGNDFDLNLQTMDDLHKPALDGIGYQDLTTNKMAWWDEKYNGKTGAKTINTAGKQPAWLYYMTNYNKVFGNFAIKDNEMFMTLNRKYEIENQYINQTTSAIGDLTTYIDPEKYNYIFADTSLDAMNFWVS